jgi:hypothetical protein
VLYKEYKMNRSLSKFFWGFNGSMCVYGITRGYRIKSYYDDKPLLFTDKLFSAITCGYIYGLPIVNLMYLKSFIDRIEIHTKGLNNEIYKDSYKEMTGICDKTF